MTAEATYGRFGSGQAVRRLYLRLTGAPRFPASVVRRIQDMVGGHNGWLDTYGLMGMSKLRFYSESMRQVR